jgi:hypothetical protein
MDLVGEIMESVHKDGGEVEETVSESELRESELEEMSIGSGLGNVTAGESRQGCS